MIVKNKDLPEGTRVIKDPHHDGFNEWCFFKNNFWNKNKMQSTWTKVNKIHPTPARIKVLASLLLEET